MKLSSTTSTFIVSAAVVEAASLGWLPMVDSRSLQRKINSRNLMRKAEHLQGIADRNNGTRKWATSGHWETLDWIYKTVKSTGYYDVQYQYFNISSWTYDNIDLSLDYNNTTIPTEQPIIGFTPGFDAEASGPLVAIPNLGCAASDFPPEVAGNIALISRGTCTFGIKNANAKNAGAVGVIIYNNDSPAPSPTASLGEPSKVNVTSFLPCILIDKPLGVELVQKLPTQAITAHFTHHGYSTDVLTANIIAESKRGNKNQVITTGAHTDSVAAGPGINDDGSGTMSQIEVAVALSHYNVKNAVRWCWWTAEEDGLLGSTYYTTHLTEEEKSKIVLNLDFDMLASNNFVYGVYDGDGSSFPGSAGPEGSGFIEQQFIDFFTRNHLPTVPKEFNGRSDYVGFTDIGVPSGGIATGAEGIKTPEQAELFGGTAGAQYDTCYHQACDTIKELNVTAWETNTKCVADSIARYATSIKGLPFPRKAKEVGAAKVNSGRKYMTKSGSMIPNNSGKKSSFTS